MKKFFTKDSILIITILIVCTILSSLYIFTKINYSGVDTEYHLSRIIGITNSWKSGDLLAFIHLDTTGYGYGMGFFYSNIFMIIPCILYLLGINVFVCYKVLIVLCSFFTALSMYVCVKRITKNKYPAIIATILYTTCSYRIITIIAKAFVGELLSFIFIPIIILGIYEIIRGEERKWWVFSLGFMGILNSNLVMTEIMIAISAIFFFCNIKQIVKNKKRLYGIIKATILALVICAAFWTRINEKVFHKR